jgi:hypothetical protein
MVFPFDFLAIFFVVFLLVCLAFFEVFFLEASGTVFFAFLTVFATALTGADLAARAAKAEANKDSQRRQEPGNEHDELLSIFRNECRPLLWSGICARCLVGK